MKRWTVGEVINAPLLVLEKTWGEEARLSSAEARRRRHEMAAEFRKQQAEKAKAEQAPKEAALDESLKTGVFKEQITVKTGFRPSTAKQLEKLEEKLAGHGWEKTRDVKLVPSKDNVSFPMVDRVYVKGDRAVRVVAPAVYHSILHDALVTVDYGIDKATMPDHWTKKS